MNIYELKPIQKVIAERMGTIDLCTQTAEENCELAHALLTYPRTMGRGQPTDKTVNDTLLHISEELVDNIICIKELIYMLNISEDLLDYIEQQKIERTAKRYHLNENQSRETI